MSPFKALLSVLLVVTSAGVFAQQAVVIKFSHIVAHDTPKGLAAEYFKEKVEAYTKGKVKVEVYANSTLFNDNEEIQALQKGSVQMLAPSFAKFSALGAKEFELFDLPYLFDSYTQVHQITQGKIGKSILASLEHIGMHGLAYWDNGFTSFSANTPIHYPRDLRGKKMRIRDSRVLEAEMRALGAEPKVMAFTDVYKALQSGAIDGTENPASNLYTQKMYEVQKHLTMTEHGYLGYVVIVNKKFWEALSPALQAQIQRAMAESTQFANRIAKYRNDQDLERIKKSGRTQIYYPNVAEREAFKQVLLPVHKEMAPRIGPELLKSVRDELAAKPNVR